MHWEYQACIGSTENGAGGRIAAEPLRTTVCPNQAHANNAQRSLLKLAMAYMKPLPTSPITLLVGTSVSLNSTYLKTRIGQNITLQANQHPITMHYGI